MKPAFILYSITHTGTHFVKQLFTKTGFQLFNARHFTEQSFLQKHVPWDDDLLYELPIVIPLRNPIDCLKSNLNRGLVLNISKSDLRFMRFINDWNYLIKVEEKMNREFVRLDCEVEDRYNELSRIINFTGFEFNKDVVKNYSDKWVPLNESNPSIDLSMDLTNIPLMKPIMEWYNAKLKS